MDSCTKYIDTFFNSLEGQEAIERYKVKLINKITIEKQQRERFLNKYKTSGLSDLVFKIQAKYNSEVYKNKWYSRGYEPPENLYYFLFSVAEEYGRECTEEEYEKHSNGFTSAMFYLDGFYFMLCQGQGSFIKIFKDEL